MVFIGFSLYTIEQFFVAIKHIENKLKFLTVYDSTIAFGGGVR